MLKTSISANIFNIHPNSYYLLGAVCTFSKVGGTITKIHIHESVFGLPGGMALDPWPPWQSNGTINTYFQESSPESSPVQNPGPVQGIVLPLGGKKTNWKWVGLVEGSHAYDTTNLR